MSKSHHDNLGDDFPSNARYGVMCVSGYTAAAGSFDRNVRTRAQHGFDFYVVDTFQEGQVVKKFTARGKELDEPYVQEIRRRAQKHASELNRKDRAHDKIHAAV